MPTLTTPLTRRRPSVGMRTILAAVVASGLAVTVIGCAGQNAPDPTETATAAPSVPSTAPSASGTAEPSPTESRIAPLTDVADCEALSDVVEPPAPTDPDFSAGSTFAPYWDDEYDYTAAVGVELRDLGVTPADGCIWEVSLYEWVGVHVGTLPSPVADDVFTTFPGSAEGQSYPEPYASEPSGAGTVYSVTSFCNELFVCDVLHYVEGDTVVTFVQTTGGDARGKLDAIVAELQG